MVTYLNQIFIREVSAEYYFSNSIGGRRELSAAHGLILVQGIVDDMKTKTRNILFFVEDKSSGKIYELSSDSFNLLLSWSLGSDPTVRHRHVKNWLQQAKEIWASVYYTGSAAH